MERRGRKPLATRHVERLTGSDYAKRRMETLLDSLRGVITIAKACQRLGIQETRFHKLRRQWLQESLSLLEPRRPGRRPRQPEGTPREAELAAENGKRTPAPWFAGGGRPRIAAERWPQRRDGPAERWPANGKRAAAYRRFGRAVRPSLRRCARRACFRRTRSLRSCWR